MAFHHQKSPSLSTRWASGLCFCYLSSLVVFSSSYACFDSMECCSQWNSSAECTGFENQSLGSAFGGVHLSWIIDHEIVFSTRTSRAVSALSIGSFIEKQTAGAFSCVLLHMPWVLQVPHHSLFLISSRSHDLFDLELICILRLIGALIPFISNRILDFVHEA